jgi:hypothetical protein
VYLSVVAIMLGYLGAYEQQLRGEIAKLAGWPRRVPLGTRDVMRETFEYAAKVMGVPRVLMVWEESEEPWIYHACWSLGDLSWEREPPGALEPVVAGPLGDRAFLLPGCDGLTTDGAQRGGTGASALVAGCSTACEAAAAIRDP